MLELQTNALNVSRLIIKQHYCQRHATTCCRWNDISFPIDFVFAAAVVVVSISICDDDLVCGYCVLLFRLFLVGDSDVVNKTAQYCTIRLDVSGIHLLIISSMFIQINHLFVCLLERLHCNTPQTAGGRSIMFPSLSE